MLLNGVHVKALSERLGHGSINITLSTYAHLLPASQVGAADTMERLLKTT